MKRVIIPIFVLLTTFNLLFVPGSNFFIGEKSGLLEHYSFRQEVYIHYIRGVHKYYPNIIILGDIDEYGRDIKNTSSIFSWDYIVHRNEKGYYDKLYAFQIFLPREGLNWVLTTVECDITANIMGVKILFTSVIKLNSPFLKNHWLKPNYSSPFRGWFWLESSAGIDIGIYQSFRVDFVREGVDLGIKNSSDPFPNRIMIEVPKDNYVGLWNFSIFVGVKDIEFKGNKGEVDNYIVIIAKFSIHSYELRYSTNYFLSIIWFLDMVLFVLLGIVLFEKILNRNISDSEHLSPIIEKSKSNRI